MSVKEAPGNDVAELGCVEFIHKRIGRIMEINVA